MNWHLSEDQIARCIVGEATVEEREHTRECLQCGAELSRFSKSVDQFQSSIREQIHRRIALVPTVAVVRPYGAGSQVARWILVAAAAVVLVVLPFLRTGNKPVSIEVDADAVMNRVNLHLARTVPEPMEPLMMGLPDMNP